MATRCSKLCNYYSLRRIEIFFSSIPFFDYSFFLIIRDAALEHDGLQQLNTVGITGLEFLDLSGNDLATEGFPMIRDFVCKQTNLRQLILDDNELEDEGEVSKINLMTFPSTFCITHILAWMLS